MHAARAGVATAGAALLLAACGGSSHPAAQTSTSSSAKTSTQSQPVAGSSGSGVATLVDAATRSSQAPGESFTLTAEITSPSLGSIGLGGAGAYDNSAHEGHLNLAVSIPNGSSLGLIGSFLNGLRLAVVTREATVYAELPSSLTSLISGYTGGKPWLVANLAQLATSKTYGGLADLLSSEGGLTNPVGALAKLTKDSVQKFTKVGAATVGGTPTTHYRADIDLAALESSLPAADKQQLSKVTGLSEIPYNVYIDGSGRIREISFDVTPSLDGLKAEVAVTTQVVAYGAQAAPKLPSAGETVNLTALLAKLG